MVLEYVPGTGKSEQLLHNRHTYYRVAQTDKWICTNKSCAVSLKINAAKTEVARESKQHAHGHLTLCSSQKAVTQSVHMS